MNETLEFRTAGQRRDALAKKLGKTGESIAVDMVRELGWTILEKNWRAGRYAEVDIIARDADTIVFIEVKTRRSPTVNVDNSRLGFEKIDWRKQRRLIGSAAIFLCQRGWQSTCKCRFDAIVVHYASDGPAEAPPNIVHVLNAFTGR